MKKLIFVVAGFVFLFSSNLARADIVINEIMYAPQTGSAYEWVEIFNSGNSAVDLGGWRFFHGEASSGPLTLRSGNSTLLQPGEYAIIAKSPASVPNYDWLNFSGMILSASTLSLPDGADNTYIAVASDASKTISNSVVYDTSLGGSKDSGNSLAKINNAWVGRTPTPGAVNEIVVTPPPAPVLDSGSSGVGGGGSYVSSSAGAVSSTSTSPQETKTKVADIPKIKTKIVSKTLGFVGLPLSFQSNALGYSGEQLNRGKYFWNFGDGDSKEVRLSDGNKSFTHTYFYPGDYTVYLDYYQNYYSEVPDASDQITIKVIPANISISRVGDEKDFFIEISNNTDYSADISRWSLVSGSKRFELPKNTILASRKKLIISPKFSNLSFGDKAALKLITPQGEVAFDFSPTIAPLVQAAGSFTEEKEIVNQNKVSKIAPAPLFVPEKVSETSGTNSGENLVALASAGGAIGEGVGIRSFSPMISIIFILFVGMGTGTVYFIRRRKILYQSGSDFEILDE
ncbi:MAG: lamin tail domain-containing protein [bacterium]